jgi:nicotinamidase-related amidase
MNTSLPQKNNTTLLIIDVQERLRPAIAESESVIAAVNQLVQGAQILGLPILVTEQYPKGLGHTVPEVILPEGTPILEKICFSCMLSENVSQSLKSKSTKHLIIAGLEAHICVLKTTLDAIEQGYTVHVVAEAVSSRSLANKQLGLERMRQAGAFIVSIEMILFMLLEQAGTEEFKAISKLIK